MKKVDAIIIGAGRSGTTSLYEYLDSHPDVCFSNIKEIHYFSLADLYERGEDYYHSFYKAEENQINVGADTYLLIDKNAAERVKNYNPDMKIIIILREPAARAYSGYIYAINNGYLKENISFTESVKNEDLHIKNSDIIKQNNLCNLFQSKYYEHLSYWMKYFPKENFLILKTNDLNTNTKVLLNRLSDFLNIPDYTYTKKDIKANKAAKSKSKVLQQFLLNRNNPMRILLRKILPKKIKSKILHSKLPEKLSNLNRTETVYKAMTEKERKFAEQFLQEDSEMLKNEFQISF